MTKYIFLLFSIFICGNYLSAQNTRIAPPKDAKKYVEVDDDDHDFGQIQYAKPVVYNVHIQNISKDTLALTNVQVSCGCTVPTWKPGPYAPMDTFSIKVAFNGYTEGKFNKTLTLLFNNNIVKILRFQGEGVKSLKTQTSNQDDDMDENTALIPKKHTSKF